MTFNEALRAMLKGKKVKADCWEPKTMLKSMLSQP